MGFGTQNQLGNRSGITNQTSLADLFGGVNNGGGQQPGGQAGGGFGLFDLLQQLLGGGGGFQADPTNPSLGGGFNQGAPVGGGINPVLNPPPNPFGGPDAGMSSLGDLIPGLGGGGSPVAGNLVPGGNFGPKPPIGGNNFGRGGGDSFITPIGGTPLTSLSNPFSQLINQRAIR